MFHWKHGDGYGQKVFTASKISERDYEAEARKARIPNAMGTVVGHSDGHGLCFKVKHELEMSLYPGNTVDSFAWYDPDELTPLGPDGRRIAEDPPPNAGPLTSWERLTKDD